MGGLDDCARGEERGPQLDLLWWLPSREPKMHLGAPNELTSCDVQNCQAMTVWIGALGGQSSVAQEVLDGN